MENDIMGERLKGLYEAITSMSSNEGIESPFMTELVTVKARGKRILVNQDSLSRGLNSTMKNDERTLTILLDDYKIQQDNVEEAK
jgi:hypothetical protein